MDAYADQPTAGTAADPKPVTPRPVRDDPRAPTTAFDHRAKTSGLRTWCRSRRSALDVREAHRLGATRTPDR